MRDELELKGRLSRLLGVRPGEGRASALLFTQLFLASAIFTLGRTVRDTLFLSRYSLSALPWMFVLYGVASALTAVAYARIADRIPRHVAIVLSVAIGILTYLGVWFLVRGQFAFIYPAFYVWSEVVANLFIVQFWTLANDLCDARAAKRLFGAIGSARMLGVVAIGVSTGAIVRAIGTEQLLFVLCAMMAGIGVTASLLRGEPRPEVPPPPAETAKPEGISRDPHVRALALFLLVTFTALTIGDYQFKAIARATYREDALAQFFGLFYAATGVVASLFQIFVTPRILRRFGVGFGMSVMPSVFGLASALLPFVPTLPIASGMKFADNGFQYTIHETTLQALYVPFPARAKARTRALLDVVVKPCSYGAGGLVLVLLSSRLPVQQLSFVSWGLVLAWFLAIPLVKSRYLASLEATLTARGSLAEDADFVLDAASRKALIGMLNRGNERQVLAALEQLATDDSPDLARSIGRLAREAPPRIRSAALLHLSRLPGDHREIAELGLGASDATVRAAAARAFSEIAGDECVERLTPLLSDPDQTVRIATTAGLIKRAGVEGAISGGDRLEQLMSSTDPAARTEAALTLGEIGQSGSRPLRRLLSDPVPEVRRAALKAAEHTGDARLTSIFLEMLGDAAVRQRAMNALVAVGMPAVEPLLAVMDDDTAAREVRLFIPRILRRIPAIATYRRLFDHVEVADSHLRLRVMAALGSLRRSLRLPPEPLERVRQLVELELGRGYRNLSAWEAARPRYDTPLLSEEMSFRHQRAIRRLLRLCELRYDQRPLVLVRQRMEDPARRANALEMLDTLLEPALRALILPFLENTTASELLRENQRFSLEPPTPEEFMREEAAHPNPYIVLVVLDALARQKDPMLAELGRAAIARREPLAREAAVLALAATGDMKALEPLEHDPDETVAHHARLARQKPSEATSKEIVMHSTVEKILYLKSAPLFGEVTGEDLAPLARVAEEETFEKGAHIVEEGESGESLYVIVSGKVAIEHAGGVIATLGAGEAFGEMAVLDNAPRSASAVAIEDTEVLRIGRQAFYEILHEQVEIAVGVIRMLTARLRDATSAGERAERVSSF